MIRLKHESKVLDNLLNSLENNNIMLRSRFNINIVYAHAGSSNRLQSTSSPRSQNISRDFGVRPHDDRVIILERNFILPISFSICNENNFFAIDTN